MSIARQRLRFPRFRNLSGRDLQCDLHLHTRRTDGEAEVDAVLERASALGLRRIAFTEHVRRGSAWFSGFAREVRYKARAYPELQVLLGCETKALDEGGTLDASEAILADCDIVLGSVHRFPGPDGGFLETGSLPPDEFAGIECRLALGLLRSGRVDVLAHPGGMYARRHGRDLPAEMLRALMSESIARGVAVEVNASYVCDLDAMLRLFEELDPFVSIGSDMHRLEHLGRCRDLLQRSGRIRPTLEGQPPAGRQRA